MKRRKLKAVSLNVTVGRSEGVGSDTSDVLDDLFRPTELGDDCLIRLRSERSVGPSMNAKLMAIHVLSLEHLGPGDGATANDEESGLQVVLVQELKKIGSVWRWTIIERSTPGQLVLAGDDIGRTRTVTTSPPASAGR